MKRPAVFLDRDGTICEEVGYLDCPERLRLIPRSPEAIRRINQWGMGTVVVTNQSGVARGYFSEADLREVHERLLRLLEEQGAFLDGIYYCPHHPTVGEPPYRKVCSCRKPSSGLLLQAATDLDLDLRFSYAVGDRWADLEGAMRLGARGVLVLTGYGREELAAGQRSGVSHVAGDLYEAVEWILKDMAER
ncbi:MAG: HAD family hydrolase [Deltaproteobacteria bacterium]|nr:HAD family hydrolase [Deltaproteobacteria bacterium]